MAKIIKKDRGTSAPANQTLERIASPVATAGGTGRKVIKATQIDPEPEEPLEAAESKLEETEAQGVGDADDETAVDDSAADDADLVTLDPDLVYEAEDEPLDETNAGIDADEDEDEGDEDDFDGASGGEVHSLDAEALSSSAATAPVDTAAFDEDDHPGLQTTAEGSGLHRVGPPSHEAFSDLRDEVEGSALHRMPKPDGPQAYADPREGSALHRLNLPEIDETNAKPSDERAESSKAKVMLTPQWPQARDSSESVDAARTIIARAKKKAEARYQSVEQEIAEAMASQKQRGLDEGLQQTQVLQQKVQQLAEGLQREVEGQALEAAVKIARRLLEAELESNPEAIVSVVHQALDSARQQPEIFVRVNPVHIEVLRANKASIIDALGRAKDLDFREDPDLKPGGCMVETEVGTIDARLSTQFDVLALQLTGGH